MFLRKARRDLLRVKGQFAALTMMVMLGVGSLTAIYGGYANLQDAIDDAYSEQRFHDGLVEFAPMPRSALPDVGHVEGVTAWDARHVVELPAQFGPGREAVMARLVAIPDDAPPNLDQLKVVNGTLPIVGASMVVAERGFAVHHGLAPGIGVSIVAGNSTFAFTLSGTATSPEYLWPAKTIQEHMPDVLRRWGVLWIRQSDLDGMLGQAGVVNQVTFATEGDANDVLQNVASQFPARDIVRLETREGQASNVQLSLMVDMLNLIAFLVPFLFLTIVGLSTYVMLSRLVHQQRANIGLMRALGYKPATIAWHFITYAPLLALAGAILGFGAGHALSYYVTDLFASLASLTEIQVRIRPELFLLGLSLSLAFALAASILPARAASRLQPAEAMRAPKPPGGRGSRLDRVVPGARRLPFPVRLGLRSVARNPRRTVLTMLGVGLAVGLLLVPLGFLDAMDRTVDQALVRVQRADEILVFREPVPESSLTAAGQMVGVTALEPVLRLESGVFRDGKPTQITISGIKTDSELLRLFSADGERMHVTDKGILLSRVFEQDGYRTGDRVALFGEDVLIAGFVQTIGGSGYVPLATAQRWAGLDGKANQALLVRGPGAVAEDLHARLGAALPLAASQDVDQALKDTRAMLKLFYGFVFLLLGFAVAISGAILLNAISINVLEESRDFATLRTLGLGMRSIFAFTTTETLALATPGVLLGLAFGTALAAVVIGGFASDIFIVDPYVSPTSYGIAFGSGLLVAFLAQVPSVRRLARMDLAKTVRERAA